MKPKIAGGAEAHGGERYDRAAWDEKLRRNGPARALLEGRKIGVPQHILDAFVVDVFSDARAANDYAFIYRFRRNMGIGTEDDVRAAGEQAYRFLLEQGDRGAALSIAEDVFGRDSDEWRHASSAADAEWKKTEQRRQRDERRDPREERLRIPKHGTFADLFRAMDELGEQRGIDALHFEDELHDHFDDDVVAAVLELRLHANAQAAASTRVMDFFKERGYSQRDITAFLPITFSRTRS